jgi:hypothetical protein
MVRFEIMRDDNHESAFLESFTIFRIEISNKFKNWKSIFINFPNKIQKKETSWRVYLIFVMFWWQCSFPSAICLYLLPSFFSKQTVFSNLSIIHRFFRTLMKLLFGISLCYASILSHRNIKLKKKKEKVPLDFGLRLFFHWKKNKLW